MKLLFDENVPLYISEKISSKKHKVTNVCQEYKGVTDEQVFEIAYKDKQCVVTADHHFDKFKHKKNYGIIRLAGNLKVIDENLKNVLSKYKLVSLENTYIKINNNGYKVETNKYHKNKKRKEKYTF